MACTRVHLPPPLWSLFSLPRTATCSVFRERKFHLSITISKTQLRMFNKLLCEGWLGKGIAQPNAAVKQKLLIYIMHKLPVLKELVFNEVPVIPRPY